MIESLSKPQEGYDRTMPQMFTLSSDVEARLNQTIIRYEGVPVYVISVGGDYILIQTCEEYVKHQAGIEKSFRKVDYQDPLLDISTPPVGYFNFSKDEAEMIFGRGHPLARKSRAGYSYLNPAKQWKQGLRLSNLPTREPVNPDQHFLGGFNLCFYDSVNSMINGDFPSIQEALFSLDSGESISVAISREVALVKENTGAITVGVCGEGAGIMIPSQNIVYLKDRKHSWVIEEQLSRFQLEVKKF